MILQNPKDKSQNSYSESTCNLTKTLEQETPECFLPCLFILTWKIILPFTGFEPVSSTSQSKTYTTLLQKLL